MSRRVPHHHTRRLPRAHKTEGDAAGAPGTGIFLSRYDGWVESIWADVRERVGSVDARARHDTRRVQWFAMGLEEVVERAVAAHWADGALESDLRLADIRARRRAMEDTFVVAVVAKKELKKAGGAPLESIQQRCAVWVRTFRERAIARLVEDTPAFTVTSSAPAEGFLEEDDERFSLRDLAAAIPPALAARFPAATEGSSSVQDDTLEQEWRLVDEMEADEVELIVSMLLDNGEMENASTQQLLLSCSQHHDSGLRQALAEALAVAAPSLEALGTAGLAALHRLAADPERSVALAARAALQMFDGDGRQGPEGLGTV